MNAVIWHNGAIKSVPLNGLADFARPVIGGDGVERITAEQAYQYIPWLRRCVDIRANAISSLPYEIDGKWPLENILPELLYRTEISLCLYGKAFWLLERRGRTITNIRYAAPQTITIKYDKQQGIIGYVRSIGNTPIDQDSIIPFFEPSINWEVGPGYPLADAALNAATIAYYATLYAGGFFQYGAIPPLILSVEGNPPREDVDRLEAWWKKAFRGWRRMWNVLPLRASIKPVQLSPEPEKLAMTELLDEVRRQIATALGVPQTLIEDAANYATAKEHRLSFYDETIIPRSHWYESIIQQRLIASFRFVPSRLEIYQQQEMDKANSLVALYQAGLIDKRRVYEQMGWEYVGEQPEPTAQPDQEQSQIGDVQSIKSELMIADLRRLRDKIKKHGGDVKFESEHIPQYVMEAVKSLHGHIGLEAFRFIKSKEPSRDDAEKNLEKRVKKIFDEMSERVVKAIENRENTDAIIDEMGERLLAEVTPVISMIYGEELMRTATEIGVEFDAASMTKLAMDFAREYSFGLVRGIKNTTRNVISNAVQQFVSTPGMSIGDLRALLEPAFGSVRAQMIAVTEVTRTYAEARLQYRNVLANEHGIQTRAYWQTRSDEVVCPICLPLNNKPEEVWRDAPGPPPGHVNCRCWVTLRVVR